MPPKFAMIFYRKTNMCVIYERVLTAMVTHLSAGSHVDQKHIAQGSVLHL